MLKDKEVIK